MTVGGINAPALFHAHGRQIISGIGWELMTALAEEGSASLPEPPFDAPHPLLAVELNAFQAAVKMDEMALGAGVTLCLRQQAVAVLAENGHVEAVLAASPEGLERIEGRVFIDCTGDADVCAMAGAAFELGQTLPAGDAQLPRGGRPPQGKAEELQPLRPPCGRAGLSPRMCGAAASARSFTAAVGKKTVLGAEPRQQLKPRLPPRRFERSEPHRGERSQGADPSPGLCAGCARKRRAMKMPSWRPAVLSSRPGIPPRDRPGIRHRRRLHPRRVPGDLGVLFVLSIDAYRGDTESALDNEFHAAGRVPGIPYGALTVRDFDNLMMAGRNASGDRRAQSAFGCRPRAWPWVRRRTAAAMAARESVPIGDVNVPALRERLAQRGAIVPEL